MAVSTKNNCGYPLPGAGVPRATGSAKCTVSIGGNIGGTLAGAPSEVVVNKITNMLPTEFYSGWYNQDTKFWLAPQTSFFWDNSDCRAIIACQSSLNTACASTWGSGTACGCSCTCLSTTAADRNRLCCVPTGNCNQEQCTGNATNTCSGRTFIRPRVSDTKCYDSNSVWSMTSTGCGPADLNTPGSCLCKNNIYFTGLSFWHSSSPAPDIASPGMVVSGNTAGWRYRDPLGNNAFGWICEFPTPTFYDIDVFQKDGWTLAGTNGTTTVIEFSFGQTISISTGVFVITFPKQLRPSPGLILAVSGNHGGSLVVYSVVLNSDATSTVTLRRVPDGNPDPQTNQLNFVVEFQGVDLPYPVQTVGTFNFRATSTLGGPQVGSSYAFVPDIDLTGVQATTPAGAVLPVPVPFLESVNNDPPSNPNKKDQPFRLVYVNPMTPIPTSLSITLTSTDPDMVGFKDPSVANTYNPSQAYTWSCTSAAACYLSFNFKIYQDYRVRIVPWVYIYIQSMTGPVGSGYNTANPLPLSVFNITLQIANVDSAGLSTAAKVGPLKEDGTYTDPNAVLMKLTLTAKPEDEVVLKPTFNSSDLVNVPDVVFNESTWNIQTALTLTARNNNITDWTDPRPTKIVYTAFSTDPNFQGRTVVVEASVKNDDFAPEWANTPLNPPNGPTNGGYLLTLLGKNFNQGTPEAVVITVGGSNCANPKVAGNGQSATCSVPAGIGLSRPVVISLYTGGTDPPLVSPPMPFAYQAPQVSATVPATAPAAGGTFLTVFGSNFGGADANGGQQIVTVGVTPATPTGTICSSPNFVSHSVVICTMPAGAGINRLIVVTVGTQPSPSNSYIGYNTPLVSTISPALGPTAGNTLVTVTGLNFGPLSSSSGLAVKFSIPALSIPAPVKPCGNVTYISDSLLTCRTPAWQGKDILVSVTLGSQDEVNPKVTYTYQSPSISSIVPSMVPPINASISVITILGTNFAPTFTSPIVNMPNTLTTRCDSPFTWTDSMITCRPSQGVGASRPLTLVVASLVSNSFHFGYLPPIASSLTPSAAFASAKTKVTIMGVNFGFQYLTSSIVEDRLIITPQVGTAKAIPIPISECDFGYYTDNRLVCSVPPATIFESLSINIRVQIAGQLSNPLQFDYVQEWAMLTPPQLVARPGRFITIAGNGFYVNSSYYCNFTIPPAAGAPVGYLVSPNNKADSDQILRCELPQWLFVASSTSVSVFDNSTHKPVVFIPGSNNFLFAAGWDSISPQTATAGLNLSSVAISGGGFNGNLTYTCIFTIAASGKQHSSLGIVVGFNQLNCPIPETTLGLGGNFAVISITDPMSSGGYVQFVGTPDQSRIQLTMGVPEAANAPSVVSVTPFKITLSWLPPTMSENKGSAITQIRLLQDGSTIFAGTPDKLSAVAINLFPRREYSYQIAFDNAVGNGIPGPTVTVTTLRSAPILWQIVPPAGFQAGGVVVTIYGEQFGITANDVSWIRIAGSDCIFENSTWTNTSIVCRTPPSRDPGFFSVLVNITGYGLSNTLSNEGMAVPLQNNQLLFEYRPAPTVTAVLPDNTPVKGLSVVTVFGSGFGASKSELLAVSLAGFPCSSFTLSSRTMLLCSSSNATRVEGPVHVTTLNGGRSQITIPFRYTIPELISVDPAQVPIDGGTSVTITGRYLGKSFSDLTSIRFGDYDCDMFTMVWVRKPAADSIIISSPTVRNLGSAAVSIETFSGGVSTSVDPLMPVKVEFIRTGGFVGLPPLTTAVVPNTGLLYAKTLITIYGDFFGQAENELMGIKIVGETCFSLTWLSQSSLTCVTGEMVDASEGPVVVTTKIGGTGTGDARFRFLHPIPIIEGFRPTSSSLAGQIPISIRGKNFGLNGRYPVTIKMSGFPCLQSDWIADDTVVCLVPSLATLVEANITKDTSEAATLGLNFSVAVQGAQSKEKGPFFYGIPCDPPCGWNGVCNAITGQCKCNQFYFSDPGCDDFVVTTTVVGDYKIFESSKSSRNTSYSGIVMSLFKGKTGTPPTSDVRIPVALATFNDSEGRIVGGNTELIFTPSSWNTPQTITVEGLPDSVRDGSKPVKVIMGPLSSNDPGYNNAPKQEFVFMNMDSPPEILDFNPKVSNLKGLNITIWGSNFDPSASVLVGGKLVDQSKVDIILRLSNGTVCSYGGVPRTLRPYFNSSTAVSSNTTMPTTAHRFAASQFVSGPSTVSRFPPLPDPFDGQVIEIHAEILDPKNGYQDVAVQNADAQASVKSNILFVTDACVEVGFYGKGSECLPCPEGAECPGGSRMIPKQGYWTSSETSSDLQACEPKDACMGGPGAPCAPQYTGPVCGVCALGYYRDPTGECTKCPKKAVIALLVLVSIALWIALAAAGWWLHASENVDRCAMFVLAMQTFGAVGGMLGPNSPKRIRQMFDFFSLFSGDYGFMKPECSRRSAESIPFWYDFVIQIVFSFLIGVVLVIGVPVIHRLSRWWNRRDGPEIQDRKNEFYLSRRRRMFTVWCNVVFYPLTRAALMMFACVPTKGESGIVHRRYYLVTSPGQQCFKGAHRPAFVFAMLLFIFFSVGYPIELVRRFRSYRQWLYLDLQFAEGWSFVYGGYKPKYYMWFLVETLAVFILAAGDTIIKDPKTQVIVVGGTYAASLVLMILFRPYHDRFEGFIQAIVTVITILAVAYNYLTQTPGTKVKLIDNLTTVLMALCLMTFLILLLTLVYFLLFKWHHKSKVKGEDYFISKAIDDSFKISKEIGDYYIQSLAQEEEVLELIPDPENLGLNGSKKKKKDPLNALVVDGKPAPAAAATQSGQDAAKRTRRVLKSDFLDVALQNIAEAKGRRFMNPDSGAAGGDPGLLVDNESPKNPAVLLNVDNSDSDSDDSDVGKGKGKGKGNQPILVSQLRSPRGLGGFLSSASGKAQVNRYGTLELPDDESNYFEEEGDEVALLPIVTQNNNDNSNSDPGLGVFYDDPSAVEAVFDAWRNFTDSLHERTPQDDARAMERYRVNVDDPASEAPERIHDINRALMMRRLQVALLDLASVSPQYVVCLKTFDNAKVFPNGPKIGRTVFTRRFIFPWNQAKFNGDGSLSEMLDALVFEICEQVRVNLIKRLSRGHQCVISDLVVKTLDFPHKRMLFISIKC